MNKKIIVIVVCLNMTIVGMDSNNQLPCPMMLLSKDIAQSKIVPLISLQETGRLKQTSKWCNELYNAKSICPCFKESLCSTHACSVLAKNYYACTKALAHCALSNDEEMFRHWWVSHEEIRYDRVSALLKRKDVTVQEMMGAYSQLYPKTRKVRKKILNDVRKALKNQDLYAARTIVVGSDLKIFDLIKEVFGILDDPKMLFKWMLWDACRLNDPLLVQALCSGTIGSTLVALIMEQGDFNLLMGLIELKALNIDVVGSNGKTLLHYAAEYNMYEVIKILIENGIYVNCTDNYGMRPLHYAAKNRHVESIIALLESNDADPRFTNEKGKSVMDYVSREGWESGDDKDTRLMIKGLLKKHIENVSQYKF